VTLKRDAPDGFLVRSRCGDDDLQCKDYVRTLLGLPAWSPGGERPALAVAREPRPASPEEAREAEWKQARIAELFDEAREPRRTIVEVYLNEERNLPLTNDVAGAVLRYHPACPWKDEHGAIVYVPAMLAAMRDIHTDELRALHRTRLTADGKKVDRRMFGEAGGAVVKLDADEDVTMGLVVTEGIETGLAARQLGFRPVWALGSAGAIGKFPPLSGIEGLTLAAEEDKTGANERAIAKCGARWREAGRTVVRLDSVLGGDLNDALKGGL
jgi:hypothetical protein